MDASGVVQKLNTESENPVVKRLGGVSYMLAEGGQYNRLHRFLEDADVPRGQLSFPTVYAERGGKLLGVAGTTFKGLWPVMAPFYVAGDSSQAIIRFRLAEAYDHIMRASGAKLYMLIVDRGNDGLLQVVRKLYGEPSEETSEAHFFKRRL